VGGDEDRRLAPGQRPDDVAQAAGHRLERSGRQLAPQALGQSSRRRRPCGPRPQRHLRLQLTKRPRTIEPINRRPRNPTRRPPATKQREVSGRQRNEQSGHNNLNDQSSNKQTH
jgi:hypothetical protein